MREDMKNTLAIDHTEMEEAVVDAAGSTSANTLPDETGGAGVDLGMDKPAISELQAAADTFSAAFNTALYEIESSRRLLDERSARISELNEAIQVTSSRLDDEIQKGRGKEAVYLEETGRLNQGIREVESERDSLQERMRELENDLDEQASEINRLSDRIEELNTTLEENSAAGLRALEELESEKSVLNGRLNELQELYDGAGRELENKQNELEENDRQITAFRNQIDALLAEVESKDNETAQLNAQVKELQEEIDAQSESMHEQSESHKTACDELNAHITGVTGELESLRTSYADLQEHAEKLENLNHALHESSVTEKAVHRQQLEEKDRQLESLRSHPESTADLREDLPDITAETDELKQSLHELESRLEAAVAENQELGIKAEKAGRLEDLNSRLRVALRKARDYASDNKGESQDLISLQEKVVDLQSALEAACGREESLTEKLQEYEAIAQEVINPCGAASDIDNDQSSGEDASSVAVELRVEADRLSAELTESQEKCRQLEAALVMATNAAGSCSASAAAPGMDMPVEAAVPGRSRFISHLDGLLAQQEGTEDHHSLMYVLLDNFVRIRDEIGVMGSESVVTDVATIIESECKGEDFMTRFGDCTFAILCSRTTTEEAEERAGRICAAVEARIFEYSGRSLMTTTSIGVCSLRRSDVNPEDVISRVDVACDAARLSGGNRVIASSAIADEITIAGSLEDHKDMVRSTISENRIRIYYQPISNLREQSGNHFEVLARIVDKSGDMILPGEFFAMAEGAGYANEVDRFVIDRALQELSANGGQHVKYYIKLTRQSVADYEIPDYIATKIEEYGVEPEQLVFEIAENILQSDLKNMATLSRALNGIGCKIAIEHYKMSTSQQHLTHVHADYLKIDKSLVGSIDKRGKSLADVTAIIDLATRNNYITIAEGVESPASLAILWEMGVSMVQGYFIQAPAVSREYVDHNVINDCGGEVGSKATFVVS